MKYIDSNLLEEWWQGWNITKDPHAWDQINSMVYKMCSGIATHFNPRSEDEHQEHVHDAYMLTIEKIRNGKLKFTPGRAPVFNLLTTTIFRQLYSKMNKEKRRRNRHTDYSQKMMVEHNPNVSFVCPQKGEEPEVA